MSAPPMVTQPELIEQTSQASSLIALFEATAKRRVTRSP